ncbi:cell division protein MraZ [Salinisphaera orenii MK-B5]|uniref:Transcriptional regulator MraZ n=2 Tax=Salinisphaera orenii TaxID=856731 RepID=A0A423PHB8_9GAMM|nr:MULTISPECIES: division/cell wall cluster transcriptional repressor MraZ [Salinisphaera]ROO25028.1 cell division protein MraZ [Salinisphaera orenii MK-B5]ROO37667.1 cell division protein MraZ [Salinisphaera halophila YIM 95161]
MFKGSHPITVDAKGRIAIPASYRQSLIDDCGGRMVVTQHWDGCLLLYPQPEYQKFEAQLLAKGSLNNQVRDIQRFFLGKARDADMDRQGRLLLPANLRTFAGLGDRAVLSGMGNLFEIWDEATFEARNADTAAALARDAANGDLPDVLMDISL